jgi:excisionase family DNA binding protein
MVIKDKSGHLLTLKEAAQLLHIHVNTLRRWSDRGSIHAYRINRRGDRRFRLEDINLFLSQLDTLKGNEEKGN